VFTANQKPLLPAAPLVANSGDATQSWHRRNPVVARNAQGVSRNRNPVSFCAPLRRELCWLARRYVDEPPPSRRITQVRPKRTKHLPLHDSRSDVAHAAIHVSAQRVWRQLHTHQHHALPVAAVRSCTCSIRQTWFQQRHRAFVSSWFTHTSSSAGVCLGPHLPQSFLPGATAPCPHDTHCAPPQCYPASQQ
jgi:hypothetical protein